VNSVVVIQARTNSSRLPGKVLLPLNGIAIVVLAARRAANTGKHVLVATSKEASDDALVRVLQDNNIAYYRGSLDNTLERVVSAVVAYDGDALIFRLTADNVFPDGTLLDEMEEDFLQRGLDYLCCNGERSGLPYGMSAELTRIRHLRQAVETTQSQFDKEHVTPFIRRQFGEAYFEKYLSLGKGYLRCTIDCLDDYQLVQRVFASVDDPVTAPVFELLKYLEAISPPRAPGACKLILGTAQLGMRYGIANVTGQPSQQVASTLVKRAISQGVAGIDTARAYGSSEMVIGSVIRSGWEGRVRIITKLSPLAECDAKTPRSTVQALVDTSVLASCLSLGVQKLDVLMLHRASHLYEWGGTVWNRVKHLQQEGRIAQLGASIQSPNELAWCLEVPEIQFIQLPCNLLDWRWDEWIPKVLAKKKETGLKIHVRSTLLQGLLVSRDLLHWQRAGVADPASVITWLEAQASAYNKNSIASFCLTVMASQAWVDSIVAGVENQQQLEQNLMAVSNDLISESAVADLMARRPRLDEATLNPASWKTIV